MQVTIVVGWTFGAVFATIQIWRATGAEQTSMIEIRINQIIHEHFHIIIIAIHATWSQSKFE